MLLNGVELGKNSALGWLIGRKADWKSLPTFDIQQNVSAGYQRRHVAEYCQDKSGSRCYTKSQVAVGRTRCMIRR